MSRTKLVICGAKGRMGQMLLACGGRDPELDIVGAVDVGDDLGAAIARCDVVIEFALAAATLPTARLVAQHCKALVIGTTGHEPAEKDQILAALRPARVVWASNFSAGVNTLFWAAQKVAEIVGPGWEAEIVETHHTAKKDAPSGTAKTLQEILERARGKPATAHSLRIGDVVGDHTVTFGTPGERLELTHRAASRETFALGALRAAKWLVGQPTGLYDMRDVLGLK